MTARAVALALAMVATAGGAGRAEAAGGDDGAVAAALAAIAPDVEAAVVVDVASGRVLGRAGAVERPLPAASTFKIVDALAAGARPELLAVGHRCAGRATVSGHDVRCWTPAGHGELALEDALALSCNVYFAELGALVGTPSLVATARVLGVGVAPGALPATSAPAPLVADGEGVRVTALQLAALLRQVALGRRTDGAPLADAAVLSRVRAGLRQAVTRGTAARAALPSVAVAGKTGTSALGAAAVGWFIGYAPAEAPSVVVAIARRGAVGASVAGLAPPLLEAFFHGFHGARPGEMPAARGGRRAPTSRTSSAAPALPTATEGAGATSGRR